MESFKELGLTKYEILTYTTLIKYGKLNAKNISKYSKVPPTAVYPNLKELVNKKLIQEIKGDVSLFGILPVKTALNLFVKEKEKELLEIKQKAIKYSEELLGKGEIEEKKEVMFLTYGKDSSRETYLKYFEEAKISYYILGWKLSEIGDKYNLLKGFQKLIKKKVDVRIILTGSLEKNWQIIKDYIKEGIKIKYLPLENFSIFIMDSEVCKITLKDKKLSERFNIEMLDKSLSKAMNFYFLQSWEHAKELKFDKKLKKIVAE